MLAYKSDKHVKPLEKSVSLGYEEKADEQKITVAPLIVPDKPDKEGEVVMGEAVDKAVTDYMENFDERKNHVNFEHAEDYDKGQVVRVWTTLEERSFETAEGETKTYPENTALFAIKHHSSLDWDTVKNGDIKGFSMEGYKIPVDAEEVKEKLKATQKKNGNMTDTNKSDDGVEDDVEDTETQDTEKEETETVNISDIELDVNETEAFQELQDQISEISEKLGEQTAEKVKDEDYDDEEDDEEDEDDAEKSETDDDVEDTEKQETEKSVIDKVFSESGVETEKSVDDEDGTTENQDPIDKVFGED